MADENDTHRRSREALLRRFPDRATAVGGLMERSEAFRDMGEELSAAEAALLGLSANQAAKNQERQAECEGWIDRLIDEISHALNEANVVSLPTRRPGDPVRRP